MYTKAIEANPTIAIYYGNRSFAYLRTECFGYALEDASKAIELDKTYIKGYYRRASAYMSLGKFKLALKDYEAVSYSIILFYYVKSCLFYVDIIGLYFLTEISSYLFILSTTGYKNKTK